MLCCSITFSSSFTVRRCVFSWAKMVHPSDSCVISELVIVVSSPNGSYACNEQSHKDHIRAWQLSITGLQSIILGLLKHTQAAHLCPSNAPVTNVAAVDHPPSFLQLALVNQQS
jgi:hypothetical protein